MSSVLANNIRMTSTENDDLAENDDLEELKKEVLLWQKK